MAAVLVGVAGNAAAARPSDAAAPEERCSALARTELSTLEDAPARIADSSWVGATAGVPAHCRVRGHVEPAVGFEAVLPATGWNGKFIELGCGGFCGWIDAEACHEKLRRGYACIVSDMGHEGEGGRWALDHPEARADWAYRGPHVTALVGKALVNRYYGAPPAKSYFDGCSTGGRLGLVEAQRFPWDFDGIIAGAPPVNFSGNSLAQLWGALAATGKDGRAILDPASVALLHEAVLAQCDLDDGIRDGIVGNPRHCRVDPASLACSATRKSECLSAAQVTAAQKIYAGPFASGESHSAGYMPGSELAWVGNFFSADGGRGFLYSYAGDKFRYALLDPAPGERWQPTDLDFTHDRQRLGVMESLYSASNPDLRPFRHRGGKLLIYQGWNDPFEPPAAIIDYFEAAERVVGNRAATQEFFRLFMIPGMNHCGGGEGAWRIDYLPYLERWVEDGKAPDRLVGAHPDDATPDGVAFTRPVYPYPQRARFKGTGDPRDADSFGPDSN